MTNPEGKASQRSAAYSDAPPFSYALEPAKAHAVGGPTSDWTAVVFIAFVALCYASTMMRFGQFRALELGSVTAVLAMCLLSGVTRRFMVDVFPGVLIGWGYDLFRVLNPIFVTPQRVHGCDVRRLELMAFPAGPNLTFADYFSRHHAPFFDLIFAIPYAVFLFIVVTTSVVLLFRDRHRMRRFLWAIGIAYSLALITWLVAPVAPPWYLQAHGCDIDMAAAASPAGLLRVDQLLGISYFSNFYSKNPAIFAAFPSMHTAFPMLGLLTAWRVVAPAQRVMHLLYAGVMFCASVYLGHHWIIDGLAGWFVAFLGVSALSYLPWIHPSIAPEPKKHSRSASPAVAARET